MRQSIQRLLFLDVQSAAQQEEKQANHCGKRALVSGLNSDLYVLTQFAEKKYTAIKQNINGGIETLVFLIGAHIQYRNRRLKKRVGLIARS
jgi:hypothetical protein